MANYVYVMRDLRKTYPGGKEVLKGITLSFLNDAKIGIVGYNGAGKSTLLKIMAGLDNEFTGEAWAAKGIRVGYLPQEPTLDETKTVKENILEALKPVTDCIEAFNTISSRFAEELSNEEMDSLLQEQAELQEKIEALDGWDIDRRIDIAMDALRCPAPDSIVSDLSGGERRRVALCKLLLEAPDILLLDEPTNHLDAESVAWLERHLKDYKGMVMAVTHDRYFLDNLTSWILELDRGEGIPYEGNYSQWLLQKQKRLEQEEREESAKQRTLKEELSWISQSQKARQTKSKARIDAYEKLLSQENEEKAYTAQMIITPGTRLGSMVVRAENLYKAIDDRLLIENLSFNLPAGGIVGVIGANGAGKTTLFRMITGQEQPTQGTITVGDSVVLGYVDQSRDSLANSNTIFQEICEGQEEITIGKRKMMGRAYVAQFNFKGSDQQKKVGQLSGGERNRVHMAKMLKKGANVLLLDEPTNDLDIETLRALEEALTTFSGCAVIISHDRWFLNRLATHMLAFEGNSQVVWFEGNYDDYEADKKKRLGLEAEQPHRLKYKPLTR